MCVSVATPVITGSKENCCFKVISTALSLPLVPVGEATSALTDREERAEKKKRGQLRERQMKEHDDRCQITLRYVTVNMVISRKIG